MSLPASADTSPPRIDALTGLRGVAILAVICRHAISSTAVWPTGAAARATWHVMNAGWVGVDVFFVLSGYLITGILLDARGDGAAAPRGYYTAFYARRALRIFPVYYLFLAVVFAAGHVTDPRVWWYWTYTTNMLFARSGFWEQPHLWSLAVEEQFYLIWPTAISILPRRWLRPMCWTMIVGTTALRIVLSLHAWIPAYVLTICRLDEFAAGALLASYAPDVRGAPWARWARPALTAAVVALVALAFTGVVGDPSRPVSLELGCLLTTIATVACIALVSTPSTSWPWLTRVLRTRALVSVGTYSYAMYIVQLSVGNRIDRLVRWPIVPRTLAVAVVCWAIGWVSWRVLERPLLSLKRFVPMPRPAPSIILVGAGGAPQPAYGEVPDDG